MLSIQLSNTELYVQHETFFLNIFIMLLRERKVEIYYHCVLMYPSSDYGSTFGLWAPQKTEREKTMQKEYNHYGKWLVGW